MEPTVDMLTHAADNPPPSTLVVIAGNNDFSYAISILRLRRYDIVLVCPKERTAEHSQASLYLDWFSDILGHSPPVNDVSPSSPREDARARSNTNAATTTLPPQAPLSQDRNTPSLAGFESLLLPNHPGTFLSHEGVGDPIRGLGAVDNRDEYDCFPPTEPLPPPPSMAPVLLDTKDEGEMERMHTVTHPLTPIISLDVQRPSSAPPSYLSFSPAPSPSSEDVYALTMSRPFDAQGLGEDHSLSDFMGISMSEIDQPISQPQSPGDTSTNTITPQSWVEESSSVFSSNRPAPRSFEQSNFPQAPAPDSTSRSSTSTSYNLPLPTPRPSAPSVERIPSPSLKAVALGHNSKTSPSLETLLPPGPLTPTAPPLPNPSPTFHPPAPDVIPDHFKPLVKKLQLCRAQGQVQPLRPGIAAEIVSAHRGEMEKINASSFLRYAQLAEQAGIVELSLPGEKPWIALRPELYEYHLE
ncbi:hypothetical protein D9756_001858 [Leucocoprinus leucothites]|uniref:NYN domain-containing protein n=1 Tax=Leucocoprinus leucothites TaxID=201217 RepID=A0A8H5G404_9AGAR|nr:hypothetical protein D9756_001858 [Leucoagaricus leucothites]